MSERRLRILHLEDVNEDAELVRMVLEQAGMAHELVRVDGEAAFRAQLDRDFDVILADYSLPAFDGLRALQMAQERRPDVPFLFVTGALRDDSAVETLRCGATDFIVKDRLGRLAPAVERALREAEERANAARASAALRFLAEASGALAGSLDADTILAGLARVSVPAVADACLIATLDGPASHASARPRIVTAHPPGAGHERDSALLALLEHVLGQGEPELRELPAGPLASAVAAPLRARDGLRGALVFAATPSRRPYDSADLELFEDLAHRVSLAIENADLYREVQHAVKARDDMLSVVSHDLRNPLGAIMLAAGSIANDPSPAWCTRMADTIVRAARTMTRLISDLLDLAHMDAGTFKLERQAIDVEELLRESVELHAQLAADKRIRLEARRCASGLTVHGDRDRVHQVLSNLIGNAMKFTPEGGSITLSARDEGEQVRIATCDTGRGIPAEHLSQVFQRYWSGTPRDGTSLGLGLAIVKGLVEAQGGSVHAASTPGKGATLSFTLPRGASDQVKPPSSRPTVLLVDDDIAIRMTLSEALAAAGYHVLTAADGVEALERLRVAPAELVILDLMMPRMDGVEFRAQQRRDPSLARIPTVVITAFDRLQEKIGELAPEACLKKPLRMDELLEVVRGLVDPSPAGSSLH
jgi:signal transduction histidine kinase/CheY-like chemotaxis protein